MSVLETLRTRKLIIPMLAIFIALLVQTSWVGDDAFITMRTADNFVHGYGLRWNVDERVQSYTNPLWMFLVAGVYFVSGNSHLTLMFLSILVSAVAVFLLLLKIPQNDFGLLLAFSILVLSKAFIDYSSSGLENPATHLLLLAFAILYLQTERPVSNPHIFVLSFLAGLAAFNRIDTILFYLPVLAFVLWQQRSRNTLYWMLAGFTPFILWELFSLIYYGFLFPNTYYAKLHAGVPTHDFIAQGLLYFLNSLGWNPITLTITISALVLTCIGQNSREKLLALGVLLYLGYIISIGGDFMSGRFFTAPLFMSVILLVRRVQDSSMLEKWIWISLVLLLGLLLAPIKAFADPLESSLTTLDTESGIADERVGYYRSTNLLFLSRELNLPPHPGADLASNHLGDGKLVILSTGIGMLGYYAGPRVHIIDLLGLADPLLARLPIKNAQKWRIGHFRRSTPDGYKETIESSENSITDPALAAYYDKLRLITRGDLWTTERWEAIWKMNTGQYDYLLDEYLKSQK
jgi:arabinofuranosyltransferase